jgi:hypothetical protein
VEGADQAAQPRGGTSARILRKSKNSTKKHGFNKVNPKIEQNRDFFSCETLKLTNFVFKKWLIPHAAIVQIGNKPQFMLFHLFRLLPLDLGGSVTQFP